MVTLFIQVLFEYRDQGKFKLHEFVVMPDHFHLLITPVVTLERSLQFIKGGFAYGAGKLFGLRRIWQNSFHDRRVRDAAEYETFRSYIHANPAKRRLVSEAKDYPYSSAPGLFRLDPPPQRLKPLSVGGLDRSAKVLLHP